MTKWFDTNYHYIVPEFQAETKFQLSGSKPFDEFKEALALGIRTKPVLIGPLTYLYLGQECSSEFERLALLDRLLPVYADILGQLNTLGAEWVQIDEPILAFELSSDWQTSISPGLSKSSLRRCPRPSSCLRPILVNSGRTFPWR